MSYTKGPWHWNEMATIVSGVPEAAGAVPVASVNCADWQSRPPALEREANAKLIAAAPELLEACEAALAAFRGIYDKLEYTDDIGTVTDVMADVSLWPLTQLRDAINKAKGEA